MLRKGIIAFGCTFLFIQLQLIAQKTEDYSKKWKLIEGFEKKGLTASALKEAINIYTLALQSDNNVQQIKAAIYQIKYRKLLDENSHEENIFYIDTLIAKAKSPAKNILLSMQAELFWRYKQDNRYQLYSRTAIVEEKSNDISTWSIPKLNKTITDLYKASLMKELLLKNTSLDQFEEILTKGENTRNLRPTLYDFIAFRALEYFMDVENDVTQPAYKFILNDERIFAPASVFCQTVFNTKDSASLDYNSLLLLQNIMRFHLGDTKPEALIDADLQRLDFANARGIFTNKNKLYEDALISIETTYKDNPAAAKATLLRAELYKEEGARYDPLKHPLSQFEIRKAKELCDQVINHFPGSAVAKQCKNLLAQIKAPLLKLSTEKVNVPGQPFKSLLEYKNVNRLYIRIIRMDHSELKRIEKYETEKRWQEMINLTALKSETIELPDLHDYQSHSTEIKTDALTSGIYIILISISPDFNLTNNYLGRQITHVSNISYINNDDAFYMLNRDNGQPLVNAEVQLWKQVYNSATRKYEETKKEKYISNKDGYLKIKKRKADNNYYLQIKHNGEELFTDDQFYSYYYDIEEPRQQNVTFLFTDRSIYRPGQTLFFKGIVVGSDKLKKRIIGSNFKTSVTLFDANNQKTGSIQVISNEYGTYNGSYKLPATGLTGVFYIQDSVTHSLQRFNVEEYKRPKFIVEVKNPAGSYRLNDSIKVNGTAKAYAGNIIDGAKVVYRVVRKTRYPPWVGFGSYFKIWPPMGNNEEMEITNGETTSDANGNFTITFKAIPDESVDKKDQPVFNYEVSADITDNSGETRNGNTTIAVAYQAIQLDIVTADKIPADSLQGIKISSRNLNDLFEKIKVTLTVEKLASPDRIFRDRFWKTPDQFIMTKDEFARAFPYDAYADEDQPAKWALQQKLIEVSDTTSENNAFTIKASKPLAGWYRITVTGKDKYGEDVRAERYIRLTEKDKAEKDEPVIVHTKTNESSPGQKIDYSISTGFDNVWMIHVVNKPDEPIISTHPVISYSNPFKNEINITEADRGGIGIDYAFVKHNRVYNGNVYFSIPWDNKDLHISYETFRDKILPGSQEKWKMKIEGAKSEKVAAEALISMYDASLDQINPHSWTSLKSIWPNLSNTISWTTEMFMAIDAEENDAIKNDVIEVPDKTYDALLNNGWNGRYGIYSYGWSGALRGKANGIAVQAMSYSVSANQKRKGSWKDMDNMLTKTQALEVPIFNEKGEQVQAIPVPVEDIQQGTKIENDNIKIRKNFNETAFFFPSLYTDTNGAIEFSFTIPEALTTWKMMTLAHTKDLASVYDEKTVITQKPLMVQPNAPRFFREGDRIEFVAKIVNLSDSEITGTAQLELFDAFTNQVVDGWFKNIFPVQYFTVAANQSTALKFPVDIPYSFNSALIYRIKAISKDGSFSDGEEAALPVLTNRTLVTETLPLNMRNESTKQFKFEKLLNSNNSGSLAHHALTVEYTSNPAWYAVQALPYLMEYPYECAEQSFNRYYANILASYISNSIPKIKSVFEKWKRSDTAALLSNLQKNEELKSALLQETPWVMEAQNESSQKNNIALLFDMIRLAQEKEKTLVKLEDMQTGNGGFSWFKDGPDDRYITQYIITGIGHLRKLNAISIADYIKLKPIVDKALPYLDARLKDEYDNLKKYKLNLKDNHLSYMAIQYLYMRSFFSEQTIKANCQPAINYFLGQAQKYWLSNNKYMQAMIALALYRSGDEKTAKAIIASLKENAIYKEEMGMYFKDLTTGGYYWQQAPVESQAMIIEAFSDIDNNNITIDDLKTWLLKQKQTQNWKTTKATAEACYALLLKGNNWLASEREVSIHVGNTIIKSTDHDSESGTGYFKQIIPADKIQQGMGNITVNIKKTREEQSPAPSSWGAVYWQYFEDLDKISSSETPLKLVKKLFIEKNSDHGPVLEALNDADELHVGDKVKVRIELKADRDMEYIHMKDMRAACMEPVNALSQFKWQGGLGYYESTKDASTNFFFGWLPRGSYVFEYPMFVTHSGNFSNGITTIQCMYAPEFTSHSEGIRITVAEK